MKITIIHKEGCHACDMAIREFTGDGHEVELYHSLEDITDADRRNEMLIDLAYAEGDKDAFPLVFAYDRFIPWQTKKGE